MKKKKKLNDDIEILDDDVKKDKSPFKNILLIISILLLVLSIGICGYLYYQNKTIEKEVQDNNKNITKVQEKIEKKMLKKT